MPDASAHYDRAYFDRQRVGGEFGGWANLTKFAGAVKETDTVLDFGCGGGFLLKKLHCARRLGVEINPAARETPPANGVGVHATSSRLPDACARGNTSHNAPSHTTPP